MRFIFYLLFFTPPPGSSFVAGLSEKQVINLVWPYIAAGAHKPPIGRQRSVLVRIVCPPYIYDAKPHGAKKFLIWNITLTLGGHVLIGSYNVLNFTSCMNANSVYTCGDA